jgi:zinc and cadmium transporter
MFLESFIAALVVALSSLVGALFYGGSDTIKRYEHYIVSVTVGVFLSLVLMELLPETFHSAPEIGGVVIMLGLIAFYILSKYLHQKFHQHTSENCDRKSAATMVLTGDAIHNIADGLILGGAFLVNPVAGIAVAFGIILHEVPQEIAEFGILLRAGYTKRQAMLLNLFSASSILFGVILINLVGSYATTYVWIITAFAAGNLLYLAIADLLPRVHDHTAKSNNAYKSAFLIAVGFIVMSSIIAFSHEYSHSETENSQSDTDHSNE